MRAMKDSGIDWIGEIPKEWNVKKLKFSCKLFGRIGFRGYTADDLVEESEGAITLSPTNMNNFNLDYSKCSYLSWDKYYESPEIMVEVGDVLLVKTASVGKCSYVDYLPKETTVNPQILVLKEHKDCSKFVAYLFHTSIGEAYIDTTKGGSTIYTISQEKIGNFEFAFPPFTEQQRIAEFLDRKCAEVDEMIALQEQIIEELKAYKQSVITEAVTKGLNPDVPMKDSGIEWIGSIPEHWEACKLKRKYRLLNGRAYSDNELLSEGRYRILRVGNLFTSNHWYYSDLELEDNKYCEKGDLLYGWSASIGPYMWEEEKVIYHYHIWKVLFAPNSRRYVYYQLQALTDAKKKDMHGTAMQHLTMDNMNNSYIATAPLSEQQTIADYLDEKCADIDALIATKQQKIDSLKEYKKSIIYEYVTGKKEIA